MDISSDKKAITSVRETSPRTIRKKSLPPFDRHISRIDRARYELSPSSSSNSSTSSFQSSLQQTILKKNTLKQFAVQLSKSRQTEKQHNKQKDYRFTMPIRTYRVNGWKDDYYSNLLDWSNHNFICVALRNDLLFYNMTIDDQLESSIYRKYQFQKIEGDISSIRFSPKNNRIGVAYTNGALKCYDYFKERAEVHRLLHHSGRISALEWSDNIIFSGGKDSLIKSFDVKSGKQCIFFQKSHYQQVCGVKTNGNLLASGGNDNLVSIYDIRKSAKALTFYEHSSAIKALDWLNSNTLLSGGGTLDRKIKFWKDCIGVYREIDTGSQVCGIKSSITTDEFVTCQGYSLNQIIIWSQNGKRELTIHGHTMRVLYCSLSPSGQYLATGAGDQQMKIWKLFPKGNPSRWEFDELR